MRDSVLEFARRVVKREHVAGQTVLEVGSYNINGSIRPFIESFGPSEYVGVDARKGPGVDQVADCANLVPLLGRTFDLVVCVETLEHCYDWRAAMQGLTAAVAPGGWLLLATLTPHHPKEKDVVLAHDHWVFTGPIVSVILTASGFNAHVEVDPDGVLAYGYKLHDARLNPLENIRVRQLRGAQRKCV